MKRKMDSIDSKTGITSPIPHPRSIGWITTAALALGGSNLSLYMIAGLMTGQGSSGIILLMVGVVVSWFAIPCWTELLLLFPTRVGGISACTAAALKSENPILASLIGVAYWSCTVPGVSFSASFVTVAFQQFLFPNLPINITASIFVLLGVLLNMLGIKWIGRFTIPFAAMAIVLSLLSGLIPIFFGQVQWVKALSYQLITSFPGFFGVVTSILGGIYLIAFSAPAFEQGLCYVGETREPAKNLPRLMRAVVVITFIYYMFLPFVWYIAFGVKPLTDSTLIEILNLSYVSLFKSSVLFATASFIICNSIVCLISSLSCSSRTIAQLAEDGLVPESLGRRSKNDSPWAAVLLTAGAATLLIYIGNPNWLIAATNYEYILCITLASMTVVIMRYLAPNVERPYRASNWGIFFGLVGVLVWGVALIFGFQQFGLVAVIAGITFPFWGLILYLWRKAQDRRKQGKKMLELHSLQLKLTGAMMTVLALDSIGYLIAVYNLPQEHTALITALEDIFVVVALLTLAIGLFVPSTVAHTAIEMANAARKLTQGTLSDFANAMRALGEGNLDKARARIDITPVKVASQDEIGMMGESFNELQKIVAVAAIGLDGAREGLSKARKELLDLNLHLEERVTERTEQLNRTNEELHVALGNLKNSQAQLIEAGKMAALGSLVAGVAHEVNTPLGICVTAISQLKDDVLKIGQAFQTNALKRSSLENFIMTTDETVQLIEGNLNRAAELIKSFRQVSADNTAEKMRSVNLKEYINQIIMSLRPVTKKANVTVENKCLEGTVVYTYPNAIFQIMNIFIMNSLEHGYISGEKGEIIIETKVEDGKLLIHYFDNGIGIAKENLEKIFEPFFTTKRSSGSTGLGLSIAYNMVTKVLQGKIWAESELGSGAHFFVEIPASLELEQRG